MHSPPSPASLSVQRLRNFWRVERKQQASQVQPFPSPPTPAAGPGKEASWGLLERPQMGSRAEAARVSSRKCRPPGKPQFGLSRRWWSGFRRVLQCPGHPYTENGPSENGGRGPSDRLPLSLQGGSMGSLPAGQALRGGGGDVKSGSGLSPIM